MDYYYNYLASGKINEEQFRNNVYIVAELYYKEQGHDKMNIGHKKFIDGVILKHLQSKLPQEVKDQIAEIYARNEVQMISETTNIF